MPAFCVNKFSLYMHKHTLIHWKLAAAYSREQRYNGDWERGKKNWAGRGQTRKERIVTLSKKMVDTWPTKTPTIKHILDNRWTTHVYPILILHSACLTERGREKKDVVWLRWTELTPSSWLFIIPIICTPIRTMREIKG